MSDTPHPCSETVALHATDLKNRFTPLSLLHKNIHRTSAGHSRHAGADDVFITAFDSHIMK